MFNAFILINTEHKCIMAVSTAFNKLVNYLEDYLICESTYNNKQINEILDNITKTEHSSNTYCILPINRTFSINKGHTIDLYATDVPIAGYTACTRIVL